jgi:segregation and condensation protein B
LTIENDPHPHPQPELPLAGEPQAQERAATSADSAPPPAEAFPGDEAELHAAVQTEFAQLKEAARFATPDRAIQVLEALFFAAEKPLDVPMLVETTQFAKELIYSAIAELQRRYAPGAGVVLFDLGGRWQLRTDPQVGAYVRRMLQVKPMRLTRAALETLAIVAYRQPITRPEIEDLRGVDCGAVTKALLERKLVRILGKKDEPGRPLLYGTSKEFLELFNLRDLTQMPTLREFQELSEESRKIVEDETPSPPVAGLTAMAQDPAVAARLAQAALESDAALAQLESAMERAEESTKTTSSVLDPPKPEVPTEVAPPPRDESKGQ